MKKIQSLCGRFKAKIEMPKWMNINESIDGDGFLNVEIHNDLNGFSYEAKFWAFNRGVMIFNDSLDIHYLPDAKKLAEERLKEFFKF